MAAKFDSPATAYRGGNNPSSGGGSVARRDPLFDATRLIEKKIKGDVRWGYCLATHIHIHKRSSYFGRFCHIRTSSIGSLIILSYHYQIQLAQIIIITLYKRGTCILRF
jgi:hypothetical protein